MNKNKRPQAPKVRILKENPEFAEATRTRHAASARRRGLATDYKRKPKHVGRGWDA
jgi:hypothetical protein